MRAKEFAACLLLTLACSVAHAQIDLRVPPGQGLTATLQGLTSQIRTANAPRVLEFQFGRRQQGKFVAYGKDQPMRFDGPFLVRVRYDVEPAFARTDILLTWGSGQSRAVPIGRTRGNRTVFESGEMFFEDPRSCTGLQFCGQSEGLSYEP